MASNIRCNFLYFFIFRIILYLVIMQFTRVIIVQKTSSNYHMFPKKFAHSYQIKTQVKNNYKKDSSMCSKEK